MCVLSSDLSEKTMERLTYADIQSNCSEASAMNAGNKSSNLCVKSPLISNDYHVEYNAKVYNSASKVLEQYIKDHEQKEAVSLTKSLTRGHSKHAMLKLENDRFKQTPNTPEREIKMARRLFSEEYTNSLKEFDTRSMCTDDLLLESINVTKELNMKNFLSSCSYQNPTEVPSYKTYQKDQKKVVTSTPAKLPPVKHTFDYKARNGQEADTNAYDLYSLNGINYTPHSLKYKTSQISPYKSRISEINSRLSAKHGIKSSLSVSSMDKNDNTLSSALDNKSQLPSNQIRAQSPTPTDLLIENIVQDYRKRASVKENENNIPKPDFNSGTAGTAHESDRLQYKAGRTPFKNPEYDFYENNDDNDTLCERLSQELNTSDSKSHISVSLHLEGKPSDVKDFMEDCLNSNDSFHCEPQQSVHKTGTVESLKNMLFTLQGLQSKQEMNSETVLADEEPQIDGHSSLQKAIQHLNNLSSL